MTRVNRTISTALHVHEELCLKKQSWPPGYIPGLHPYEYHVRYSTITLSCNIFQYQPNWPLVQINHLLARLIDEFGDPGQQDNELYNGRDIVYQWREGALASGMTVFHVMLPPSPREWREFTYGKLVNAVIGVNHIRMAYPDLSMCCNVLNEVRGVDRMEGAISLVYVG
ncbi:MAG: hypothetical protein Q9212_006622 [Teloschistes hypoglaucus]